MDSLVDFTLCGQHRALILLKSNQKVEMSPAALSPMERARIWWLIQALCPSLLGPTTNQRKVPVLFPYVICPLFIVFKNDYKIIRILVLSATFSLTDLRDTHLQLTADSNSIQIIKHYDNITAQQITQHLLFSVSKT